MHFNLQLDWYPRLYFETNKHMNCLFHSLSRLVLKITRIFLPKSLLISSLAAYSMRRLTFDTILCWEGDWHRSSASKTSIPLIFLHPRWTTINSYGISWLRKWNTFSRITSFACSSWFRFVITPGENSHRPGLACATRIFRISLTPCPFNADRLMIDDPSSLIPIYRSFALEEETRGRINSGISCTISFFRSWIRERDFIESHLFNAIRIFASFCWERAIAVWITPLLKWVSGIEPSTSYSEEDK